MVALRCDLARSRIDFAALRSRQIWWETMADVADEVLEGSLGGTHSSHWGAFKGEWQGDTLVITPHPRDPDPNPIIQNFPSALRHKVRVDRPHVRRGWLEHGPGKDDRRGRDEFVPMEWGE